ncbi:glycoside hydrolase family 99-like domain-containing protein [Flavobacterium sp. WC2421]
MKVWNEWAEGNYLYPDQKIEFANLIRLIVSKIII